MKILAVNRNYFITGGPEKYLFSIIEKMPNHEFIPFCVNFEKNRSTPYSQYFVEPPGGRKSIYFKDYEMSWREKSRYAINSIYSWEARKQLERLIAHKKPDLALFLNAVYFSDSIIDTCRRYKIPVIWRMSDFNRICASYLLFRNGKICEECLGKGHIRALINRCGGYQQSFSAAAVKVAGIWLSKFRRTNQYVSFFIVPSTFTGEKMVQGGIPTEKIVHIPTMVDKPDGIPSTPKNLNGIVYVGRISPEKGVGTLIEAFAKLKNNLTELFIAGDNNSSYARSIINNVPKNLRKRIHFLGFRTQNEVTALYKENAFFVVPSICYENQPNVVLEGMSQGRPAVVSAIGSIRELVSDGEEGLHFLPGSDVDLAQKMDWMLAHPDKCAHMGLKAKETICSRHNVEDHISSLEGLFARALSVGS